ncbi:MAG: C69 family dipeptidase [Actinomycetota bacterium]
MCDSLCIVRDDRALFGKSSDRMVDEPQVLEWHPARAGGGTLQTQYLELPDVGAHAVVGSRPTWLWGFEHGVNEHRVAIGNERVWTTDDPLTGPPGLIGMDLVRLGLERAATASGAVDVMTALLEAHGQGGAAAAPGGEPYSSSFLVADPHEAWVLETSGTSWAARRSGPGRTVAISNRLSLGADWDRASSDVEPGTTFLDRYDPAWAPIADIRLACTLPALAAPDAGPADLVAILRHHGDRPWGRPGDDPADVSPLPPPDIGPDGSGVTVCMHVRDYQATTASMVCELPVDPDEPLRVWTALGSPCCSLYLPVPGPGTGGVPELGHEATWQRFAALRPQVEGDDAALTRIRSVLAPVEAELWRTGTTDWSTIEVALRQLGV